MSLQIRKQTYLGRKGFLIYGRVNPKDHRDYQHASVFTESRESAERIKAKLLAGEDIEVGDFKDEHVVGDGTFWHGRNA